MLMNGLRSCAGHPLSITVQVTPPAAKQIEIFYLFDLSGSMGDDLANVRSLAASLKNAMDILCNGACDMTRSFNTPPIRHA